MLFRSECKVLLERGDPDKKALPYGGAKLHAGQNYPSWYSWNNLYIYILWYIPEKLT